MEVQCNPDGLVSDIFRKDAFNTSDACNPLLRISHKRGCPIFSATSWVRFLTSHPWIMGTLCIAMGLIVAFYGRAVFPWVVAIIGGFVAFSMVMLLCSVLGMLQSIEGGGRGNAALTVVSFVISIAAGLALAYFLFRALTLGAAFLAAIGGFFIGFTLYNLVLEWSNSLMLLIILTFGLAILMAYLAVKFFDEIVVFGTALIGSYVFVRGISVFAGHYPNEIMMFSQLKNDIKPDFDGYFYLYLAIIVVVFILGTIVQWRYVPIHKRVEEHPHYHGRGADYYKRQHQ